MRAALSLNLVPPSVRPIGVAITLSALVGAAIAMQPPRFEAAVFGTAAVVGLALLGSRRGHWPVTVCLAWFGALGTGLDTGLSIAGAHVPVAYALLAVLLAISIAVAARSSESTRNSLTLVFLYVLATATAIAIFGLVGIVNGNSAAPLREDVLLSMVVLATGALTLLTFRSRSPGDLCIALVAISVVAAVKTIAIQVTGTIAIDPGFLQAYSQVNPQLLVQRVLLVGGDTLLALGIPIAVGLLRVSRGLMTAVMLAVLAVTGLGVSLTYTRTFLGSIAVGTIVTLLIPLRSTMVRGPTYAKLAVAIAAVLYLSSFTFGQSDFSVYQGIARRVFEGVASSGLDIRVNDAAAALSTFGPLQILVGRGLGATFVSPITPFIGPTSYVHIGYVWLLLKGGLALSVIISAAAVWSVITFGRAAQRESPTMGGAMAGLSGSVVCFLTMNLFINRFASVEGAAFIGVIFGASILVSRKRRVRPQTGGFKLRPALRFAERPLE